MPKGVNKVILVGHLGQDPDLNYTQTGDAVANVSLATTEAWTRDGEKHQKTEWHRLVFWRKLAEIAGEWLKKGSLVYVEGKLQTDQWEKDGQKHYTTKVIVNQMVMLGGGQGNQAGGRGSRPGSDHNDFGGPPDPMDDDIPF